MSAQNKKRNVLIGFGAVAAVLVAVVAMWPPNWPREDASGAIGAVQKHRETQITAKDVVLVDEQTRQEDAIVYADYLDDAAKLQNISVELSAALRDSDEALQARGAAARGALLKHEEELQARYSARYASTLASMSRAVAANEYSLEASKKAQLQSDIDQLSASLRGKIQLQSEDMASFNARLKNIEEQLGGRSAAAKVRNEDALQSDLDALEARPSSLQSRDFDSLASRLKNVSSDLNEARSFAANRDYLESLAMESRSVRAARAGFSDFNAAKLQAITASLANEAVMLEKRATDNLGMRLKNEADMASRLNNIEALLGSARRQYAAREAALDSKTRSTFNASLKDAEDLVGSRKAAFASKLAGRFQNELGAIQRVMDNRAQMAAKLGNEEMMASRLKNEADLAAGKAQTLDAKRAAVLGGRSRASLDSRMASQDALRAKIANVSGFQKYLANLDQELNGSKAFASLGQKQQFALQARGLGQQLAARSK